ncbi:uncharacterized protein LOC118424570 [Branchiostoma floridae]|uniref:Uncharacterized protein LOC118424570 n=1 Tax=Branchiostoma floridae TaxID=7739 RepID=C3ZHN1_BRAFL|nr:uncharacterized protein LOC118424570 [Branchiostoma floridae]|eukprot:XP_002592015.1 hypothetical protein BRAFLDRAFT_79604 [Branchiostoma floridae]
MDTTNTVTGAVSCADNHPAVKVTTGDEPGVQSDVFLADNAIRDDVTANYSNHTNAGIIRDDESTDHDSRIQNDYVAVSINIIHLYGNGTDPGNLKADAVLSISILRNVYEQANSNTPLVISIIRDVINTVIGTSRPDAICSNATQYGSITCPSECDVIASIGIRSEDLGTSDVDDVTADGGIALSDDIGLNYNNGDYSATRNTNKHDVYIIGHPHTHIHRWNTEFESDQSALSYDLHANHLVPTNRM